MISGPPIFFRWSKWSVEEVREDDRRDVKMLLTSDLLGGCPWRWSTLRFTCNIADVGRVTARHIVVVEVHHDDPFLLFLQRERE